MRLTRRERRGLIIAVAVVVGFVVWQVVFRPALTREETLARTIEQRRKELIELRLKGEECRALREELSSLRGKVSKARKDFGVMAYLEGIQRECGIAGKVVSMKPATSVINEDYVERLVDFKLEGVTMPQVLRLFLALRRSEAPMAVKSFRLQQAAKGGSSLNVSLQIGLLALAEER